MRLELHSTLAGEISLEIIADTKEERDLLKVAWRLRGYPMGNGQSRFDDGAMGFYIPLFEAPRT